MITSFLADIPIAFPLLYAAHKVQPNGWTDKHSKLLSL